MRDLLEKHYKTLFEPALIDEIAEVGTLRQVALGEKLIEIGNYVKSMPLLVSGAIKILREDADGNELLLYFLERGDTCAMTLTCCMGQTQSEVRAVAEMDATLVMVPIRKMEEWTGKYKSWRNFVFQSYHNRLQELLDTVDTIAFMNMDERLLKFLHSKAKINRSAILHTTHQEIAQELNTSRVVISRLLKKLENLREITLHRNSITLHTYEKSQN